MSVEFTATPIEVATITAADYLVAVGLGFVLALAAAALGAWVFSQGGECEPPPADTDSWESAETQELPESVRRRSGLRTGTLHGPVYRRSDDDTVVVKPAETRR
ncbi:hypothetical protein AB0I89_23440 [Micromonospora sp. NPDC049801]|uniref:hypothetical protein n=1 Tax=unclassified Micromonospora TaxID=2617518 RepID=UPI0033D80E0A